MLQLSLAGRAGRDAEYKQTQGGSEICQLCHKPALAKGLCSMHYNRLRRTGSPELVRSPYGEAQAFIRALRPSGECTPWPFRSHRSNGYGVVSYNGRVIGAHRAVCILHHGEPPSDKHQAAHSCGNRLCVNPGHIRWATPKENTDDRLLHGTATRGEAHSTAKLTAVEVGQIRKLNGTLSPTSLAERFGVSRATIRKIVLNLTWKDV